MNVGYLGPRNSFTFQAASELGTNEDLVAYPTIPRCIQALKDGKIHYAVVPIENSLEGSVHASIDRLFQQKNIFIAGEIILPIQQQLLGHDDGQKITKILSHPQALAQSQKFLETHYPDVPLEAVSSTTFAAEYVEKNPHEHVAAIASEKAASEYHLSILAGDIQDNDTNQTRFWILSSTVKSIQTLGTTKKGSIFFTLPSNSPGALHQVLACLAWRGIDLTKIESRPLKTNLGEYFFIIELHIDSNEQLIQNALEEMALLSVQVHNFWTYPVSILS